MRRGRPLVQQESVDLDVPEEKVAKRASTETLEGERLDDLESCMVGQRSVGLRVERFLSVKESRSCTCYLQVCSGLNCCCSKQLKSAGSQMALICHIKAIWGVS